MRFYDPHETARLTPFTQLVQTLRSTVLDYASDRIVCPTRLAVPMHEGGLMLSMPASAEDIAILKNVTICPNNHTLNLPTVHGVVLVCDALSGVPYFGLDGATVTGRRTAAMTVLATQTLRPQGPKSILVIGTGGQASHHVQAFSECFPDASIQVSGLNRQATHDFCKRYQAVAPNLRAAAADTVDEAVDLVVTLTTSKQPVYFEPARSGRLIAGVGAFTPDAAEIAPEVARSSTVIVDDPVGARHEAGDIIQAGIDWANVKSLAEVLNNPLSPGESVFYKSVGCAAWDLAACRVARQMM